MAPNPIKDQALAIAALIVGTVAAAAAIKFADLPVRVSVIESKQSDLDQRLNSMDSKLDVILGKVAR